MNTYLNSDRLIDNSVWGSKIVDKSIEVGKLTEELGKNISDSKTVADTLLQAFTEAKGNPSHVVDPFVRAGLIPIPFEDAEVKRILVEKYDTDGDGELYYKDVKDLNNQHRNVVFDKIFNSNTKIKTFNEMRFFDGLTELGQYGADASNAFGDSTIQSVEIPKNVKRLGRYIFANCISLENVSMPDDITGFDNRVFSNCKNLKLSQLPSSLTNIGTYCFNGCSSLSLTELPSSLTSIGYSCFNGCSSLSLTELPSSLTNIGAHCFRDVNNLKLNFDNFTKGTTTGKYADGCLYFSPDSFLLNGKEKKIIIPEGVTNQNRGFMHPIPYDGKVSTVVVSLPSTIVALDEYNFSTTNGVALLMQGKTPPQAGQYYWKARIKQVYVPDDAVDTYKAATAWNEIADNIHPMSEYKESDWIK